MYMYSFFYFPHILLKVKSVLNLLAHPAVAYPGFHVAKRQEVLPLPPECDDSPLQGYPPAFHQVSVTIRRYPFILLSEEKHWGGGGGLGWGKVFSLRTQHIEPAPVSNLDLSTLSLVLWPLGSAFSTPLLLYQI